MRRLAISVLALLAACAPQASTPPQPGNLTIVGGGLSDDNAAVWGAFIVSAKADGPIVIVPAASGYPSESAGFARAALEQNGLDPTRIRRADLAIMDDPTTPELDESEWATNADDPATVALLESAAAIWFTGGDQRRIAALLLETPALTAIRSAHENGAGIGGTSAGAAIMSDPMITGGFRDGEDGEPLTMDEGLGFLPGVIVDQHFSERGRMWRLKEAVARNPGRLGLGIDEDTALVVTPGQMQVLGRGQVFAVNEGDVTAHASGATITLPSGGTP